MKEQDCLLLITIYEEQNITHAAEKLYITQPALTYRLHQIEQEFSVKIILRDGKKIRFTPEGKHLINFARKTLLELRDLKSSIQDMKNTVQGSLEIGVSSNFALYKLPSIVKSFLDLYPKIKVDVYSGWSSEILQMLEKNEIQIGIVTGDYHWFGEKQPIHSDPVTIIARKPIDLEALPHWPRIDYRPRNMYKASRELTDPITRLIEGWWQERFSLPPLISMRVDKVETCKEMVKNGLGYSIVPYSCLTEDDSFQTTHLSSLNGQIVTRKTSMLYRESSLQLSAVDTFVDYIKTLYNEKEETDPST